MDTSHDRSVACDLSPVDPSPARLACSTHCRSSASERSSCNHQAYQCPPDHRSEPPQRTWYRGMRPDHRCYADTRHCDRRMPSLYRHDSCNTQHPIPSTTTTTTYLSCGLRKERRSLDCSGPGGRTRYADALPQRVHHPETEVRPKETLCS